MAGGEGGSETLRRLPKTNGSRYTSLCTTLAWRWMRQGPFPSATTRKKKEKEKTNLIDHTHPPTHPPSIKKFPSPPPPSLPHLLVGPHQEVGSAHADDGAVRDVGEPLYDEPGAGHLRQPVVVGAVRPVLLVAAVRHAEHADLVAQAVQLLEGGRRHQRRLEKKTLFPFSFPPLLPTRKGTRTNCVQRPML